MRRKRPAELLLLFQRLLSGVAAGAFRRWHGEIHRDKLRPEALNLLPRGVSDVEPMRDRTQPARGRDRLQTSDACAESTSIACARLIRGTRSRARWETGRS